MAILPTEVNIKNLKKARDFVEDARANKKEEMVKQIVECIKNCKIPDDLPATVQDGYNLLDLA